MMNVYVAQLNETVQKEIKARLYEAFEYMEEEEQEEAVEMGMDSRVSDLGEVISVNEIKKMIKEYNESNKAWHDVLKMMQAMDNNGVWYDEYNPVELNEEEYKNVIETVKAWEEEEGTMEGIREALKKVEEMMKG